MHAVSSSLRIPWLREKRGGISPRGSELNPTYLRCVCMPRDSLLTDSLPRAAHLCKAATHSGAKAAASAGVSGKTASPAPAPALQGSCSLIFFPPLRKPNCTVSPATCRRRRRGFPQHVPGCRSSPTLGRKHMAANGFCRGSTTLLLRLLKRARSRLGGCQQTQSS